MAKFGKFFKSLGNIGKQILPAALPILGNIIAPGIGGVLGTAAAGALARGRAKNQIESILPEVLPALSAPQYYAEEVRVSPIPAALTSFAASAGRGIMSAVGGGVRRSFVGGYRRRRKKALSMEEMGKIMVMAHALGKNSPSVMLLTMKALGGKL